MQGSGITTRRDSFFFYSKMYIHTHFLNLFSFSPTSKILYCLDSVVNVGIFPFHNCLLSAYISNLYSTFHANKLYGYAESVKHIFLSIRM